jgi:glycosyltransferase involved in cell wall biosynthesis
MNILFLDRFLGGHDGVGIYIYNALAELLRLGHRVGLVYGKQVGDYIPEGVERFCLEDLHLDWIGRPKNRRALERVLDQFSPDVASAQCLDVYWFAEMVARRCPLIAYPLTHAATCPNWTRFYEKDRRVCTLDFGPACAWHTYADQCGPKNPALLAKNMLRVAANRVTLRHFDAIQAANGYMRGTLEKAGVPREKIFELPPYAPFFDEAREYTPPPARSAPLILFVGRLHPTKGPDLVLEACARLRVPFELAFVGGGPMARELESLAERLGLRDRCRFYITGVEAQNAQASPSAKRISREEMSALYAESSAVLFTSIWGEPFGIVRVEGMAHGRPVIAFDAGGSACDVSDGENGFVLAPLDVAGLAARLERLLTEPALVERMGRAALQYIRANYHPKRLTERLVAEFTRLRGLRAQS